MKKYIYILLFSAFFGGCIEGGTHGYLKRYRYDVSQKELENVVNKLIEESTLIRRDTVDDYYNDGKNYFRIHIKENEQVFTYIFHFYGDEQYWNTSKTSAISLSYAYDKDKGGSSGNGIKWYDFKLKDKLLKSFEGKFILKIDKELNMRHKEE